MERHLISWAHSRHVAVSSGPTQKNVPDFLESGSFRRQIFSYGRLWKKKKKTWLGLGDKIASLSTWCHLWISVDWNLSWTSTTVALKRVWSPLLCAQNTCQKYTELSPRYWGMNLTAGYRHSALLLIIIWSSLFHIKECLRMSEYKQLSARASKIILLYVFLLRSHPLFRWNVHCSYPKWYKVKRWVIFLTRIKKYIWKGGHIFMQARRG